MFLTHPASPASTAPSPGCTRARPLSSPPRSVKRGLRAWRWRGCGHLHIVTSAVC